MLPETHSDNSGNTSSESSSKSCNETISQKGFRFTTQRREVYDTLLLKRDHPTAVDVFLRVQKKLPGISLATVYNCLETLAECGLVRAVNHDRQPSRYCANLEPHAHFFCEQCGAVVDVPHSDATPHGDATHQGDTGTAANAGWRLPPGAVVTHHDVSFRGQCGACAAQTSQPAHNSKS
jgi:Fur family peroxide stress response transcriptional regulator